MQPECRHHPAIHRRHLLGTKDFCDAGGLVGYGADFNAMFDRPAYAVERLLRGFRAGELPVEQPTRPKPVVNRGTTVALGISLPQSLLLRADGFVD